MRYIISSLLLAMLLAGCKDAAKEIDSQRGSGNSLFELSFKDYQEIEMFRNFEKISDTSIDVQPAENEFRLLELRNNSDNIVMFYQKAEQGSRPDDYAYKVIDTIHIRDLEVNEKITIGYCYSKGIRDGEIIAVVEDSDSLHIKTVKRAWMANPVAGRIEPLTTDLAGINCLNEDLKSDPAKISLNI